jgi:hypothetical protein
LNGALPNNSNRLANGQKFHDVDAAFTTLVFGHKRLRLMKAISQLALSQTRGFARLDHKFAKALYGLICRVCAREWPSARNSDPIIG